MNIEHRLFIHNWAFYVERSRFERGVPREEVSTSVCYKPDCVRRPPKRLAVRSFIYPAEAEFPPK